MDTRKRRPSRLVAVGLVLAGVAIFLSGISFSRKVASFQPAGVEVTENATHWLVTSVGNAATGLRPGDQILLVNGVGVAEIEDPAAAFARRATSELLVVRAEEAVTVAYARPGLDIDFPYLVLSLIGVGYLLIGAYTLFKDQRRAAFIFFLWCLTSAVVYVASPIAPFDTTGKAIYLVEEFARLLLAPLTLHLFLIFPSRLPSVERVRSAIPFLYLPAAVFLLLQVDLALLNGRWFFTGDLGASVRTLDRLEIYHLVVYALLALGVLGWRLVSVRDWEQRRQMGWIAVGMGAGYVPFVLLYVVPMALELTRSELLTAISVLPLACVPLAFAYSILRYKLWDIGVIVRDTISLSATILLGVFGFSLINLMIDRAVPEASTIARNLSAFAAGLVIAGLLVPARRGIASSLSRLQYGARFSRRRALSDFGRELLHENDIEQLSTALLTKIEDAVELERANLYVRQGELLAVAQPEPDLPLQLHVDALGAGIWDREVQNLSGIGLISDELSAEQRLFALGYRYAFPLQIREMRIGLLLCTYKPEDNPLNSDDIELIRDLLNQAALAIDNARLLGQVKSQLDEVLRLQHYSEGIIQSSPAGIAVLDKDKRIVTANAAFLLLSGAGEGPVEGRPLSEVLAVYPLPAAGDGIMETSIRSATRGERFLQLSLADLEDDEEGEIRQVLVVQDVSDRVAMEHELKEKERLASLGMLAAGVAHEVNTPITGISSYAQMLLADTPETDPHYEILRKVERQTFRASRIVNNLLDFARTRKGEPRPLSLAPLFQEALDLVRDRLDEQNIDVFLDVPPEDVLVKGDDGELQQVFTNLVVNAVDAMGASGGRLKLGIESDKQWVLASVEDTGPGIPLEQLDKIFQPFYSTKLSEGGTGLGLSISYNIVRKHRGEIRVVSHPGEGTRFIVELPRYYPEAAVKRQA